MPWTFREPQDQAIAIINNDNPQSIVQEIKLLSHIDGTHTLMYRSSNMQAMIELSNHLNSHRHYYEVSTYAPYSIQLRSNNRRLLLSFLTVIQGLDAEFQAVYQNLRQLLHIPDELQPYESVPSWALVTRFDREITFRNTVRNSSFTELNLMITPNNTVNMSMTATNTFLLNALLYILPAIDPETGVVQSSIGNTLTVSVPLRTASNSLIAYLWDAREVLVPHLPAGINNIINSFLNRNITAAQMAAASNAYLNPGELARILSNLASVLASPIHEIEPPPIESVNAGILDALDIKVDVPDGLCCGISGVIMDRAMHVPGMKGHYNAAHLERWMMTKMEHPATRANLVENMPVHDPVKQKHIDEFMLSATQEPRRSTRLAQKRDQHKENEIESQGQGRAKRVRI